MTSVLTSVVPIESTTHTAARGEKSWREVIFDLVDAGTKRLANEIRC